MDKSIRGAGTSASGASGASGARSRMSPPKSIERLLVLADGDKREVSGIVTVLEPWLRARVRQLSIETDVRAFYKRRLAGETDAQVAVARPDRPGDRPDVVVVLGGDGAILAAVRAFADDPVPTMGINFGRVGFLASAETAHWRETLEEILDGRAVLDPRMRLSAHWIGHNGERVEAVAMNDVVLTRGAYQGMLTLSLEVGDDWVTDYRADGLIVATPSGSTAYSMAAGGPILAPSMEGIVVTPICPQALSHRAIVLDAGKELSLDVRESSGVTTLVVDGQGFYTMHQGDSVRLKRHEIPYPLLTRPGSSPFQRWRNRLDWRGSFEPETGPGGAAHEKRAVDSGEGGL